MVVTISCYNDDDGSYSEDEFGSTENYPDAKIEIYNRWQQMVYKQDNYGNIDIWGTAKAWWDGTSNVGMTIGKDKLPAGTYYYILYFNKGTKKPAAGFIFLNK